MAITIDEAWRKAANCAVLIQETRDETTRRALVRMRNSWIAIANDGAALGGLDREAALQIVPPEAG